VKSDTPVRFDGHFVPNAVPRSLKAIEITGLAFFFKPGARFARLSSMSVLRTMSLIVGAALIALGGSAVALFL
jgi:hypothetical protein